DAILISLQKARQPMHDVERQLPIVTPWYIHSETKSLRRNLCSQHRGFAQHHNSALAELQRNALSTTGGRDLFVIRQRAVGRRGFGFWRQYVDRRIRQLQEGDASLWTFERRPAKGEHSIDSLRLIATLDNRMVPEKLVIAGEHELGVVLCLFVMFHRVGG